MMKKTKKERRNDKHEYTHYTSDSKEQTKKNDKDGTHRVMIMM
jgi:hypothetical protein